MSRISKMFEIIRTIYSNSESSVQFLKQNAFLLVPGGFSDLICKLKQVKFKLEKKYWDLETCMKSQKRFYYRFGIVAVITGNNSNVHRRHDAGGRSVSSRVSLLNRVPLFKIVAQYNSELKFCWNPGYPSVKMPKAASHAFSCFLKNQNSS